MADVVKIILSGPESSGKSWLGRNLSEHFRALYVPEYARIFLESNSPKYNFELLEKICRSHLLHQRKSTEEYDGLIFLDTDLVNYHVWFSRVFGKVPDWLNDEMENEKNHRYLLTYPDLVWEEDPLRENPTNREEIFDDHLKIIENINRPYLIIRGNWEERLANAIKATQQLLAD